jgi:hypothetical protein
LGRGRFQHLVTEPGWPNAFSDKSWLTMCEGEIVGNSPTLCGEGGKAWFIWLRVQPPNRLAFWGECWPKRPKARCYTCGRVCRGPTAWVGVPCVRAASTNTPCVDDPVPTIGIRGRMETSPAKDGLKMFDSVGSTSAALPRWSTSSTPAPAVDQVELPRVGVGIAGLAGGNGTVGAVEAVCKERPKDRRAMVAILRVVPPEMKAGLVVKKTTKEAWEAVKSMRIDDDRVKAASVQHLWKEYENVGFRVGESIGDFALQINSLVASLREMGETLEDHRVMKKILCVVPKRLKQVAVAIEMLTNLNTTTIEELVV